MLPRQLLRIFTLASAPSPPLSVLALSMGRRRERESSLAPHQSRGSRCHCGRGFTIAQYCCPVLLAAALLTVAGADEAQVDVCSDAFQPGELLEWVSDLKRLVQKREEAMASYDIDLGALEKKSYESGIFSQEELGGRIG